jgi:hypothetical protein
LYYSVSPLGVVCADGKYSWVQAETIVAAAMLASELGNNLYWCIYDQLWSYVSAVMIDHRLKCWHRNMTSDNVLPVDKCMAMVRSPSSIALLFSALLNLPVGKRPNAICPPEPDRFRHRRSASSPLRHDSSS